MSIVKNEGVSFHGEVGIFRADLMNVDKVPDDATEVSAENGLFLVAHSESGHHHYVEAAENRFYQGTSPDTCYLMVAGSEALLKHMKPDSAPDKHGTQSLGKGLYVIKKQSEEAPEGWRRVED